MEYTDRDSVKALFNQIKLINIKSFDARSHECVGRLVDAFQNPQYVSDDEYCSDEEMNESTGTMKTSNDLIDQELEYIFDPQGSAKIMNGELVFMRVLRLNTNIQKFKQAYPHLLSK